jgi:hypothetical protein
MNRVDLGFARITIERRHHARIMEDHFGGSGAGRFHDAWSSPIELLSSPDVREALEAKISEIETHQNAKRTLDLPLPIGWSSFVDSTEVPASKQRRIGHRKPWGGMMLKEDADLAIPASSRIAINGKLSRRAGRKPTLIIVSMYPGQNVGRLAEYRDITAQLGLILVPYGHPGEPIE